MLDSAKYVNHLNKSIEFGKNGIFLTENKLRNYTWDYDTDYDEISNLHKGVAKRTFKVIVHAQTEAEGLAARNTVYEILDADALSGEQGKLYIGDYYLKCCCVSLSKEKWFYTKRYIEFEVTVASDCGNWVKETTYSYGAVSSDSVLADGAKEYDYEYTYYYAQVGGQKVFTNPALSGTDFIMRFHGPVKNPLVIIGTNTYEINATVDDGEYIEVNSMDKTIYLVGSKGDRTNIFWLASKQSYIFEKISTGSVNVYWDGSFALDIVLLQERGEPEWL
ncbi:MAG: hypothetical protein LIO86_15400 [Lachnospiraceae bacterium]|nr:hypothetical protein [Lachnospiraceae bacterium]